jgi:hypothetical protein
MSWHIFSLKIGGEATFRAGIPAQFLEGSRKTQVFESEGV